MTFQKLARGKFGNVGAAFREGESRTLTGTSLGLNREGARIGVAPSTEVSSKAKVGKEGREEDEEGDAVSSQGFQSTTGCLKERGSTY